MFKDLLFVSDNLEFSKYIQIFLWLLIFSNVYRSNVPTPWGEKLILDQLTIKIYITQPKSLIRFIDVSVSVRCLRQRKLVLILCLDLDTGSDCPSISDASDSLVTRKPCDQRV